jgi:hypothetical protein
MGWHWHWHVKEVNEGGRFARDQSNDWFRLQRGGGNDRWSIYCLHASFFDFFFSTFLDV